MLILIADVKKEKLIPFKADLGKNKLETIGTLKETVLNSLGDSDKKDLVVARFDTLQIVPIGNWEELFKDIK